MSLAADPSAAFRLKSEHRHWYEDGLKAIRHFTSWEFSGESCLVEESAGAPLDADKALARVALAALFARAVYGDALRRRADDEISGTQLKVQGTHANTAKDIAAFLDLAGAHPEDILLSSWKERTFEPAFVVFRVPVMQWIVVSIRGSLNMNAFLTDLAAGTIEIAGGKAHAGMAQSALFLLEHVQPALTAALTASPSSIIVCTGHSMGGSVAALLALLLRNGSSDSGCTPAPFSNTIAYCFGGAPLLTPELAAKCKGFVLSVGRNLDMVTRLSALTVDGLLYEMTERSAPRIARRWLKKSKSLDSNMVSPCPKRPSHLERMLGIKSRLPESCTPDTETSRSSKLSHLERIFGHEAHMAESLVTPGKLLHIDSCIRDKRPSPTTKGIAKRSPPPELFWPLPSFYQRILIGSNMVHDHLQVNYLEDILRLLYRKAPPHIASELYIIDRASSDQDAERCVRQALEALAVEEKSQHTMKSKMRDDNQHQSELHVGEGQNQGQDTGLQEESARTWPELTAAQCRGEDNYDVIPNEKIQSDLLAAPGYRSGRGVSPIVVPGLSDTSSDNSDHESTSSDLSSQTDPFSRRHSLPDLRFFRTSLDEENLTCDV